MRLARIRTADGPRLHVRGRSRYVDAATESGHPQLAQLSSALGGGASAWEQRRALESHEGRSVEASDFAAVVSNPLRVLCLGVNYSEHALETGRSIPEWPESFVRGRSSVTGPS